MKKYLALMMVLVLALAAAVPAFAAPVANPSGDAAVKFAGDGAEIVDPPEDWEYGVITGLDFGTHEVEMYLNKAVNFDSTEWAGITEDIDGNKTGTIDDEKTHTGFTVLNTIPDKWDVQVDITAFKVGTTETLKGYSLTLVHNPNMDEFAGDVTVAPTTVHTNVKLQAGEKKPLVEAAAGEGIGYWGYNYSGVLEADAGTMISGQATAVMTWEVIQTPA